MGSIREITGKNGKITYHVSIRKKDRPPLSASFNDRETAMIWAAYKEMLIDEAEAFGAKDTHLYTVRDVIMNKWANNARNLALFDRIFGEKWLSRPVGELNDDKLKELVREWKTIPIRRGGAKGNGPMKLPETRTLIVWLSYYSSALSHFAKKGFDVPNYVTPTILYCRELEIQEKKK